MTRRAGFTLMEVLVAITIGSVVATIGYAAYSELMDQGARVLQPSERSQAAAVRHSLSNWLRGAILMPGVDGTAFRGLDAIHDATPADVLHFVTAAPTPVGEGLAWVRLYIDHDTVTSE